MTHNILNSFPSTKRFSNPELHDTFVIEADYSKVTLDPGSTVKIRTNNGTFKTKILDFRSVYLNSGLSNITIQIADPVVFGKNAFCTFVG